MTALPLPPRRLLTLDEAAGALSVSRRTVERLIRSGDLHTVQIGRARRIPVTAVDTYLEHLAAGDTNHELRRVRSA